MLTKFIRRARLFHSRPISLYQPKEGPIPLGDMHEQQEFLDLLKNNQKRIEMESNQKHPDHYEQKPLFEGNENPVTGEVNGPKGAEPTRYGDWEKNGRVYDF
ncbi:hypothetical protein HDV01_003775 [Terramyces sp. JEL0728]|nr:hypothetical protein HDV01_003775 [Terramyces sp. JEL0728]